MRLTQLFVNKRNSKKTIINQKPMCRWDITGTISVNKSKILIIPIALFLAGCASNKLNNTAWYNITTMQENGVFGDVGTSLVFNSDSTVIIYKGVSIDTTVILPPFIFAYGNYQYKKTDGKNMQVTVSATKKDGSPYNYSGEYNKKNGLMLLSVPDSKLKETYIWNPKVKVK